MLKKPVVLLVFLGILLISALSWIAYKQINFRNRSNVTSNKVIYLDSPKPYDVINGSINIRGRSKHVYEDLVRFFLYDKNLKNSSGTPLGLNAGSIWIKNFDADGYGTFEIIDDSFDKNNSREVILKIFTYASDKYDVETNVIEIPLKIKTE